MYKNSTNTDIYRPLLSELFDPALRLQSEKKKRYEQKPSDDFLKHLEMTYPPHMAQSY